MKKYIITAIAVCIFLPTSAQRTLNLDSCRALALRNNKQLSIARLKQDVAKNTRKAARTAYLPKVDALGGYEWTSKQISLLSDDQKDALNNLGTNVAGKVGTSIPGILTNMAQQGIITPQQAAALGQMATEFSTPMAQVLNGFGRQVTDAFHTNTQNMFMGSIMLRQPIYMGGAITAANKMATINERMAASSTDLSEQTTLYNIDRIYWMVVSLTEKEKLAKSYLEVVRKLDDDVQKMIREGVATRADGLQVNVKVNEAEMKLTQAEDGLALSKMLLCQECGLPMDEEIILKDEVLWLNEEGQGAKDEVQGTIDNRPELQMLQDAVDISKQTVKLARASYLPQLALTGGYLITNPNVYNGFQRKFGGVWNIGVMLRIPVWNWMEGTYKVRAAKAASSIATLEMSEAREKIQLQESQGRYQLKEANKKLAMTIKNVEKAEENLRSANLGFSEGVISSTTVMEAQTAWLQAHSQKIDAAIDVEMANVNMKKIYGSLNIEN
ncbi:MAG: TolC family protein [Prevotella sp.]|nr:TolC family protein [Prevotella sp.]